MLDKLLFGENYPIYNIEECNNKVILHIKSNIHQYECPHCHQISNSSASLILSLFGVKVSADTIKNIYNNIKIVDNPDIEEIGVDDVATRKGMKYATAVYDLKSHRLIAILEGRGSKTFEDWLNNHKKVKLVARDRASAYVSAINKVLPKCVQVADKYHLLENLLEKLKDIFKEEMPNEIFIQN